MLTLVTQQRGTPFGKLQQLEDGSVTVRLTSLGKSIEAQILEWPQREEGLVVMRQVVMPDHVHIIVHIQQPLRRHLGTLVQGLKYGTTVAFLRELDATQGGTHRIASSRPSAGQRATAQSPTTAPITSPSTVITADKPPHTQPSPSPSLPSTSPVGSGSSAPITPAPIIPAIHYIPPLWAEGYHDRILYGRDQLSRMLHYVSDNPRRGWIKHQHRDLFYDKRTVDLPLTLELGRWLLREARSLGVLQELRGVLLAEKQQHDGSWLPYDWWQPGAHPDGCPTRLHLRLKMMGNHFLLNEALLLPIRLSRRTPPGVLQAEIETTLTRCEREGAVVITPVVSTPEETLFYATLAAGYRAIRLQAEAMSDVASPAGRLIDYAGRGQLLLIAPWPDRPQSAHPHKGIFELLNVLCKVLAAR